MTSKKLKEFYHYLILSLVITIGVFLAYFISTLTPLMNWINGSSAFLKVIAWILLFMLYFLIILILLIPLDKFLHYLFRL